MHVKLQVFHNSPIHKWLKAEVRDKNTDWGFNCSYKGTALIHCGEEKWFDPKERLRFTGPSLCWPPPVLIGIRTAGRGSCVEAADIIFLFRVVGSYRLSAAEQRWSSPLHQLSQLKWFRHLIRMCLPFKVFHRPPMTRRHWGRSTPYLKLELVFAIWMP